jgi:SNF2 family DNA or RNA helicase
MCAHWTKLISASQFDGLLRKVADVLEESGVSFVRLTGTSSNRSNQLDSFQSGGDRVLLLNVADESAAGSNLTVANHVIFLSPLITEEAQQYHATMEQARGRAIRFGQTKEVHIHRFVAIDTIDQSTYENREQKTL